MPDSLSSKTPPTFDPQPIWNGEEPLGGQAKSIATCLDAIGRQVIFYVGLKNHLLRNTEVKANELAWSGESRFSDDSADHVALAQNGLGELSVFFIGTNSHIYQNTQTDPGEDVWTGDAKWATKAKQIAVALDAFMRLNVFYVGEDDHLYTVRETAVASGQWSAPTPLGTLKIKQFSVTLAARTGLHLFFVDTGGNLYRQFQTGPQADLWGVPANFHVSHVTEVCGIVDNIDTLHVFYLGKSGQLIHDWQIQSDGDEWNGPTPFTGDKGKHVVCGRTDGAGLELVFIGTHNDLLQNGEMTQDNLANNANWGTSAKMVSYFSNVAEAKQITLGKSQDGRLELFFVGTNDDIYHDWQTLSMAALSSNSNQIVASKAVAGQCPPPILDLVVTIDISEEVASEFDAGPHKGLGFQLNAWSPVGSKCIWQQYVIGIQGPYIGATVNNWKSQKNHLCLDNFQLKSMPSKSFPTGYQLIISLTNDAKGNVRHANFVVIDNEGNKVADQTRDVQDISGGDSANIAPILAFQMNLVGPNSGEQAILSSGAGSFSYSASTPLVALMAAPMSCLAQPQLFTAEEANSIYTPVAIEADGTLSQDFSADLDEDEGWDEG